VDFPQDADSAIVDPALDRSNIGANRWRAEKCVATLVLRAVSTTNLAS